MGDARAAKRVLVLRFLMGAQWRTAPWRGAGRLLKRLRRMWGLYRGDSVQHWAFIVQHDPFAGRVFRGLHSSAKTERTRYNESSSLARDPERQPAREQFDV